MKTKIITTQMILAALLFSGCGFLLDDCRPNHHRRYDRKHHRDRDHHNDKRDHDSRDHGKKDKHSRRDRDHRRDW